MCQNWNWMGSPPADWLMACGAIVGIIFAVWNLVVLRQQTKSALDGLALARTQQRAWVGLRSVRRVEGPRLAFRILVTNAGQTPAVETRIKSGVFVRPKSIAFTRELPEQISDTPSTVVIVPGGEVNIPLQGPELDSLTEPQIASIRQGAMVAYLYARLTYKDVVSRPHESAHVTEICCVWDGDQRFHSATEGNAVT